MSNLTALAWAEQVLAKLRRIEQSCEDSDLFCVGYLIPQVELLEVANAHLQGSAEQWFEWFERFVSNCLNEDGVGVEDATRIREIATEASHSLY
jgi:hypothetical protein